MEENERKYDEHEEIQGAPEQEVADVVKDEPDDKPAGKNVNWTIIVAIVILLAIYFIFFY
ncbi:hypothetical protein [Sphingobacterium wenxiniae]|uniref:Uncharacterized protein n=1 Tax=Sphingobacterium wenxiniae TaxID=683125 RepID=A0A1I6SNT3_9SPHI|nr:hypothetical protein [Sphingobacterium wenxiniae]SFS78458.1 hypothetical protein SAMN05660206_1053 [Sphingobacterium wenxiniae]